MFRSLRRSIRHKFLATIVGTSIAALLSTVAALLIYDLGNYKETSIKEMTTLAEVIGLASSPALTFSDPEHADRVLTLLRAQPRVNSGIIFDAKGAMFATFSDGTRQDNPPLEVDKGGFAVEGDRIAVSVSIVQNNEVLGKVYLQGRYEVASRLHNYLRVLIFVTVVSLLVAFLLSAWLRRTLTDPVVTLAVVTKRVMHEHDFSQRVKKTSDDELGELVDSFNEMIAELGQRSEALESTNLVLAQEVGVRTAAEAALREADQRKDEFIAVLSHELRNPLSPIRNAVAMLNARPGDQAVLAQARGIIDRQSRQLARLIDDLMDVSRIKEGKLELRLEEVELSEVVDQAVEASRDQINAKKQHLDISLPQQSVRLRADSARIAQVFGNLLGNASKYTDTGGHIRLQAQLTGHTVAVTITDDGIGIPPEALPDLFHMFSQVKIHRSRAAGGLGIGLALVKGLVEKHGGSVQAQSDGSGSGSRFTVFLPVTDTLPRAIPHDHPITAGNATPLRILVADDMRDSRDSLAMLLRRHGHEVHTAGSGEEALVQARTHRPELAILDIGMPDMTGYEVARRLRSEAWGPSMTLIALTGWGQRDDLAAAKNAGFDHHMTKPTDVERLLELLARTVDSMSESAPAGAGAVN
jgi:signal transduction histidine kinase/ActR/RegA family two-component response regulator